MKWDMPLVVTSAMCFALFGIGVIAGEDLPLVVICLFLAGVLLWGASPVKKPVEPLRDQSGFPL